MNELIGARPLLKHFLSFNKWLGLVSSVDVLKWNVKPVPDELNSDRAYSHHRPVQKEPGLLLQLKWRYAVYARWGNDHDFAHYLSKFSTFINVIFQQTEHHSSYNLVAFKSACLKKQITWTITKMLDKGWRNNEKYWVPPTARKSFFICLNRQISQTCIS